MATIMPLPCHCHAIAMTTVMPLVLFSQLRLKFPDFMNQIFLNACSDELQKLYTVLSLT